MAVSSKASSVGTEVPEEQFVDWEESPDYDGWYSFLISFSFHLVLILTFWLLSVVFIQRDALSPPISVVQVGEADATGVGNEDAVGADGPVGTSESNMQEAAPTPLTQVEEVTPIDSVTVPQVSNDALKENINQQVDEARRAVAAARAAVAGKMSDNLAKSGGGGAGGAGAGAGGGSGAGTGRAGRAARWVLQFDTQNPKDYLAQLGGLGAEIAFPQRGDKYVFFSNLADAPKSAVRDLASESRIYWMDTSPNSYQPVARELGVGAAPLMVAFMPLQLEEKMLKLELAYKGAKSEDEIQQTVFKCLRRGGTYDVIIVSQRLKNER